MMVDGFRQEFLIASQTYKVKIMEFDMVLLAMLPEEDGVMLVQTPRLHTIADLEDFIVDEYSRVFPHLPPLSQNLRIQKCVAPELVVDRRAHTAVCQKEPHVFVSLAKNVQVGNAFENMEQIYIVVNESKKLPQLSTNENAIEVHSALARQSVLQRYEVVSKEAHNSREEGAVEKASKKTVVEKKERTTKKLVSDNAKKTPTRKADDTDNLNVWDTTTTTDKKDKFAKRTSKKSMKKVAEEISDALKVVAKEAHGKIGINNKRETIATAAKGDQGLKMTAKKNAKSSRKAARETSNPSKVICEEDSTTIIASKKAVPKKSENALLKKMLAAKHDAASSGATLIANSPLRGGHDVVQRAPSKSEKRRKISDQDASAAEKTLDFQEPPAKKKKSAMGDKSKPTQASQLTDEEQIEHVYQKPVKNKVAAEPLARAKPTNSSETVKMSMKIAANKLVEKTNDDSSTASEVTPSPRKSLKKIDTIAENDKKAVSKRAMKEVSAAMDKAIKKAKLREKVSKRIKNTESDTTPPPSNVSRSSSRSSSSSTQAGEPISSEETKAVESLDINNTAAILSIQQKPQDESTGEAPKSRFQTIMAETKRRIAKEKEAQKKLFDESAETEKADDTGKQTQFAESTASESSSDSDAPSVVEKVIKRSPMVAAPVGSSSSSSLDDDEQDYSQNLLADLTKDDAVAPVVVKKNKKPKKEDVSDAFSGDTLREMEQSQNLLSSELTQKSHESNSILLPTLSRNHFSLGSMPVAKLKKSSKNPFSSPEKATIKSGNATSRSRGRPCKVK